MLDLYKILQIFYLLTKHYMLNIGPVTGNKQAIKSSAFDGIPTPLEEMGFKPEVGKYLFYCN